MNLKSAVHSSFLLYSEPIAQTSRVLVLICSPAVTLCTARFHFKYNSFYPHSLFMFCMVLKTDSDYFTVQH